MFWPQFQPPFMTSGGKKHYTYSYQSMCSWACWFNELYSFSVRSILTSFLDPLYDIQVEGQLRGYTSMLMYYEYRHMHIKTYVFVYADSKNNLNFTHNAFWLKSWPKIMTSVGKNTLKHTFIFISNHSFCEW